MILTESTTSSNVPTQYFIPKNFENNFGKISATLKGFFTENRMAKMERIVQSRSRQVLTVFENTHHAHNISAIIRTIDSFGFMDLFFLYSNHAMRFRTADTIDRGASQWLLPKRLESIAECAKILKKSNYKIALVSLPDFSRTADHYISHIPSFASNSFHKEEFKEFLGENKIALIFGSELHGVSPEWKNYADCYVSVQMYGFTESLNVSVCAGIIIQNLREQLSSFQKSFLLSNFEKELILEHWIAKNCPNSLEFISNRHPHLLPWFEFVRSGKFFQPISS
nr:RNA methyltransferase [Pigmentibacter ruber]